MIANLWKFLIDGFSTSCHSDCGSKGGDIMLFVGGDIQSSLLAIENKPIEGLRVELNLRNDKWLINCSYNPHKNTTSTLINKLSESLDVFSADFEKVIMIGDFNVKDNYNHMKSLIMA